MLFFVVVECQEGEKSVTSGNKSSQPNPTPCTVKHERQTTSTLKWWEKLLIEF